MRISIWITRKGAIEATKGQWGVIPGSMGTKSYITKVLGNPASYNSSSHGAGRRMSRSQAKKNLTQESLNEAMKGKTSIKRAGIQQVHDLGPAAGLG